MAPAEWPPAFQAGDRGFESRPGYWLKRVRKLGTSERGRTFNRVGGLWNRQALAAGWRAPERGSGPAATPRPVRLPMNSQVVEWQTRSSQKAVPTGREGSNPSLATCVRDMGPACRNSGVRLCASPEDTRAACPQREGPSGGMADAAVSKAAALAAWGFKSLLGY